MFSEDIEFVKELYINNKINIYFFHEKYMLSPAQLGRSIRKFAKMKYIIVNDDNIELTKSGRKWIIANRRVLFLKEKEKHWKAVPVEMEQPPMKINEVYKPKIRNIDTELFNNIEDGE
jgi:hypothetical protein